MGDAVDRLVRLANRVYIPPHTRMTKNGRVDVKGYYREDVLSMDQLTPLERDAVAGRGGGGFVEPQQRRRKVSREEGTRQAIEKVKARVAARRASDPKVFDIPGRGGDRFEVRRTSAGSAELWRIQRRTGNEPEDLMNNPAVTVTKTTIEQQESVGPFEELVERARARAGRSKVPFESDSAKSEISIMRFQGATVQRTSGGIKVSSPDMDIEYDIEPEGSQWVVRGDVYEAVFDTVEEALALVRKQVVDAAGTPQAAIRRSFPRA